MDNPRRTWREWLALAVMIVLVAGIFGLIALAGEYVGPGS